VQRNEKKNAKIQQNYFPLISFLLTLQANQLLHGNNKKEIRSIARWQGGNAFQNEE
jgi:hypothetical protein